jgi:hypothetical protein
MYATSQLKAGKVNNKNNGDNHNIANESSPRVRVYSRGAYTDREKIKENKARVKGSFVISVSMNYRKTPPAFPQKRRRTRGGGATKTRAGDADTRGAYFRGT